MFHLLLYQSSFRISTVLCQTSINLHNCLKTSDFRFRLMKTFLANVFAVERLTVIQESNVLHKISSIKLVLKTKMLTTFNYYSTITTKRHVTTTYTSKQNSDNSVRENNILNSLNLNYYFYLTIKYRPSLWSKLNRQRKI